MKSIILDVCGLSCPEPVLQTKTALKNLRSNECLEVIVDTATARENISRMAVNNGWQVKVLAENDRFRLQISKK